MAEAQPYSRELAEHHFEVEFTNSEGGAWKPFAVYQFMADGEQTARALVRSGLCTSARVTGRLLYVCRATGPMLSERVPIAPEQADAR